MSDTQQEVHLRDYLAVIVRRRRTVAAFFLVVFIAIALGTFSATPEYEATTKIMIERVEPSDLTDRYRSAPRDPEFYETQYQLIKSGAVARRVVDNLSLEENYFSFMENGGEKISPLQAGRAQLIDGLKEGMTLVLQYLPWAEVQTEKEDPSLLSKELLVEEIREGLRVRPVANSRIVDVSFSSSSPELSALVANAVIRAYMEEGLDLKISSTRRQLDWMNKKAEAEGQNLRKAENDLQEYMDTNDILTLENRMAITPEKLSAISTQLVRAEFKRKELEALYKKVSRGSGGSENVAAIASDPALQSLRAQIVEAEKEIMELSSKYGQKHPVIKKALGDLEVLKDKKRQEISRIVQSIKNDYELAYANEKSLRRQLDKAKAEALEVNAKFTQYETLQREVETNRKMFDALMLKMKEEDITGETQAVNLSVLEKAEIPLVPTRPMKRLNLVLGGFLGVFGGIGLAFFREYLDHSVSDPEKAEAFFSIPVLGSVSHYSKKDGNKGRIEEVVIKEPLSVYAENYKALRAALLLSPEQGAPKRIVVTSCAQGEGKTATAVNLALALAQTELKVLLVDCDLRKPRVHSVLKLDNQMGLSTYLSGTGGNVMEKGPLPSLAVIPSGPIPPNPSELLSSRRMKHLLDSLNDRFDIIVCDSPPVLAVSDTMSLSPHCDGTLLVVNANKTTYNMANRALKQFQDIKAPVLGMVINGISLKDHKYYKTYKAYYGGEEKKQVAL